MARSRRVGDDALAVQGLDGLQRAFKRVEGDTAKTLRTELRGIVKDVVQPKARANVTHTTGRHGGSGVLLEDSMKVGVQTRGASLYTTAPHGWVQDRGGKVGRNRSTLLKRSDVSAYMSKAVQQSQPDVERRLDHLLDTIGKDFERGF